MRALLLVAVGLAGLPACVFFSSAYPCEGDGNCPSDMRCEKSVCVARDGAVDDAGAPRADAGRPDGGAPPVDGGPDAGPPDAGAPDGGPGLDAGVDAGLDAGPPWDPCGDAGVVHSGDLVLADEAAQVASADVTCVQGDLVASQTSLSTLALPALERVTGNAHIEQNAALASLAVPRLGRVDGDLVITDNPALYQCVALATERRLSGLAGLGGAATIAGNAAGGVTTGNVSVTTATEAQALAGTACLEGDLRVPNIRDGATEIVLPNLVYVQGAVQVTSNKGPGANRSSLTRVSLPALTDVGGALTVDDNDALAALEAGSLSTVLGGLTVTNNSELLALAGFVRLTYVRPDLQVTSNVRLPECEALALQDHLQRYGLAGGLVFGNDVNATCD